VGDLVSFNDGDVCNAACTEQLLAAAPQPICVDIGVDRGWWSAFCLERSPAARVYAFEPNPLSFTALQERFAAEIQAGRLTLVPKAVSSSATTIPLWLEEGCSHSRTGSSSAAPTTVETTTLDFLFDAHPRIDLLKMDTEGHEWTIFQGLAPHLGKIGALIFECSVFWYGSTREQCLSRTYEMLGRVMAEFPYVYTFSRRGLPVLTRIESSDDLFHLLYMWYTRHFQTDILATRTEMSEDLFR
jgi:FkbM family methyltransferase